MIFQAAACRLPRSPDPDEQKCGDQRELVKGVEEKEIERSECSHGAGGNQQEAGVEGVFVLGDFAGEPDGRERYDRREEHHHQAQAIDAEGEIDPPLAADRQRSNEREILLARARIRRKQRAVAASVKTAAAERRCGAPARRAESASAASSGQKTMKSRITGKP